MGFNVKDTLFTVWPRLALFYVPCDHTQVSNHLFQANSEILTYAQHRLQGRSDTSHRLVLGTWGLYTYRHHTRRRLGHCRFVHLRPGRKWYPENSHRHYRCSLGCTHTLDTCKHHSLQLKISFLTTVVTI